MRIAIFGAGGVGGYFGGRLAEAGQDVSFVARGAHLEAIRRDGLTIRSPRGDAVVRTAAASDDPAAIGPVDVVIVATKTFQLDEAAAALPPLLREDTLVVPLLNGVEAPERLGAKLDRGVILGGLCRILSHVAEPGVIEHVGAEPYVAFGRVDAAAASRATASDAGASRSSDASASERITELHDAFAAAGVSVEVPGDIRAAMWSKFLLVASWGAIGALTRLPIGVIRSEPETRMLLTEAMEEILAVGNARGVALDRASLERALGFFDGLPPQGTTSMQRDIAEGRPSELESWSGAVVRLGEEAAVAVPTHRTVHHALIPWERRARGQLEFPADG
jgi:2-dehydropantoate 2-reductase